MERLASPVSSRVRRRESIACDGKDERSEVPAGSFLSSKAGGASLSSKASGWLPARQYIDMHVTRTRSLAEGFPTEMVSAIHDSDNKEGPSPLFLNKTDLIVFFDRYMKHTYGAVLSRDHGDTWEDVTSQIEMPEGMSHGTAQLTFQS